MERFLISILGTTLSIALTFGTTALINAHKKKTAQRQTAMLVIHDINNTILTLESTKLQHERCYEAAQYFMEYMDRPEAADSARLTEAIDGVMQLLTRSDHGKNINESTEKIFTGGLDVWNNLDNMRFIENVQSFYYSRRTWTDYTNTSVNWVAPISETELAAQVANFDYAQSYTRWDILGEYFRNKLKDRAIRYFLDITPNRINEYDRFIETLSDLNEENMFLMNITDEELEAFINKMEDNQSPLNERDIVGTWITAQNASSSRSHEDEFRPDHSFEGRDTIAYTTWQVRGKITISLIMGGKWEIKNDSLIRYYDKETLKTTIDTSAVSVGEGREEWLSQYIQSLKEYYGNALKEEVGAHPRTARKGNFNLAHSKMELSTTVTDEKGEEYEQTLHLKRK